MGYLPIFRHAQHARLPTNRHDFAAIFIKEVYHRKPEKIGIS